jgi:hypothetical protein
VNSVLTKPGATAVTRTPVPRNSSASASEKLSTKGFARRVGCEVGHRLKRDLGGEVDHAATTACEHRRQQPAREHDDGLDVQADELALTLRRERDERAIGRYAGVVDEQLDVELGRLGEQHLESAGGREIGDQGLEPAAAGLYLVGECAQALAAARRRKYRMPALGQRERELATETG